MLQWCRPSQVGSLLFCVGCLMQGHQALAEKHDRAFRTPVHFLATGTSIHLGIGNSEDVYLAAIVVAPRSPEEALIRLVDDYAPYQMALSSEALKSGVTLRLRRDRTCDVAYGQMILRTAPGDPEALLPGRMGYVPLLPRRVESREIVPCYRTVRR